VRHQFRTPATVLVVAVAAIAAACSATREGARALPGAAAGGEGAPVCTLVVDRAGAADAESAPLATIQEAVARAGPGDVVCVRSSDHEHERVRVTRSGDADAPLHIRAEGEVRTAGFVVEADHVVVEGFTVSASRGRSDAHGTGIYLVGTDLRVLGNTVVASSGDGIGCRILPAGCFDVIIAGNTVRGADGSGIIVSGEGILVANNDVSGSRRINATDADGIRFFGRDIRIRANHVHDISDHGYPEGEAPHTDCFQTFDNDKPTTSDVVIEENVCVEVDHQCLIAEAPERGESARLVFRDNVCHNNGSQGVLIRDIPGVEITDNLFLPSITYTGVVLRQNATGARVERNLFVGAIRPYEVDDSAKAGFRADHNRIYHPRRPRPPAWWAEPHGVWGAGGAGPTDRDAP